MKAVPMQRRATPPPNYDRKVDLRCSCDCGSERATPPLPTGLRAEAENLVHRHASTFALGRQRLRENFLPRRAKTNGTFLLADPHGHSLYVRSGKRGNSG